MVDVGEKARSREGHAAMSMRGGDNRWIEIQNNTFKNWVNEQLRPVGESVTDLEQDFDTGVKLCLLMEAVRGKKVGRVIRKPMNQHQHLENVTLALKAMQEDKIKLVNIGSEDIVNGNLKLILGLVWHLILRYQIGKTKFPPKKLMLAWLNAVIPECNITNFTSNWNDGVALHALLDYCQPGLCPNWRTLSRSDRLENCRHAMELARDNFGIPLVVRPEDLSSPDMDELSGMTYLSYFMKLDSPGYNATLRWVRDANKHSTVNNFTTDWSDGYALCALVKSLGGNVPEWPNIDRSDPVASTQLGIDGALGLGVEPVLTAEEMVDSQGEHLGVMAYAAYFQGVKPVKNTAELVTLAVDLNNVKVGHPTSFKLAVNDPEIESKDLRVEVQGSSGKIPSTFDYHNQQANGTFTATEPGSHTFSVYCNDALIKDCPISFNATGDRSKIQMKTVDICPRGALTEMKIDTSAAGDGQVRAEGLAPSGATTEFAVSGQNGNYSAAFQPDETGLWKVSMLYDNEHVQGSPFSVNVFDPAAVSISGLDTGSAGQQVSLTADCSSAGVGELTSDVTHNGAIVPSTVSSLGSDKYSIVFTPSSGGEYKIDTKYNGYAVKDSPHIMTIEDSTFVTATGPGLGLISANRETSFDINGAGNSEVKVEVKGENHIHVRYGGKQITGTRFPSYPVDPASLQATSLSPKVAFGKQVEFEIDASKAGTGNLEILINNGAIPCSVENRGNRCFKASFLPREAIPHVIDMKFSGEVIPGSPWSVDIYDMSVIQCSGALLQSTPIGQLSQFRVTTGANVAVSSELVTTITAPSGRSVPNYIRDSGHGVFTVESTLTEIGKHQIDVTFCGDSAPGSPFYCLAYNLSAIRVGDIPTGFVGKQVEFTLDVSNAGEGKVEIQVNGATVPNTVEELRPNMFAVRFVPTECISHLIDIKFNDEMVPGSPFICNVVDPGKASIIGLVDKIFPVNTPSSFKIDAPGIGDDKFNVTVTAPSGKAVPTNITRQDHAQVVNYTPPEVGTYTVEVDYDGVPVEGSPFHPKAHDPSKVVVSDFVTGGVEKTGSFIVDASQAGEGSMEISVSVNGANIENRVSAAGKARYKVEFTPKIAAPHVAAVIYNEVHVPGSPFTMAPQPVSRPEMVQISGHEVAHTHKNAEFLVDTRQAGPGDLVVHVRAPDNSLVPVNVVNNGNSTYRCDWIPKIVGDHQVEVSYAGMPIKGSPFTARVCNPAKVKVYDVKPGRQGKRSFFKLDASEAGPGNLEIVVAANGQNVSNFVEKEGTAKFAVSYTPESAVPHQVSVKFNNEHVPGSPFTSQVVDGSRCAVFGDNLQKAVVNRRSRFTVDPRGAGEADCEVEIFSPSGAIVPATVSGSSSTNYTVEFTPKELGHHKVNIKYADVAVAGSPFDCNVYNPNQVNCTKVDSTKLGSRVTMDIDCRNAGEGDLSAEVRCNGEGVPCEIVGKAVGVYELSFVPKEASTHTVDVSFNDEQVPNAPMAIDVVDDRLVTVQGDAVRSAAIFKNSSFVVNTNGAEMKDLNIRVVSPSQKEVPIYLTHSGGVYRVEFTPAEVGGHHIHVNIGSHPIQGSPFTCYVYDVAKVNVDMSQSSGILGKQMSFTVDASEAGQGDIDVEVNCNNRLVRVSRENLGDNRHRYSFIPEEAGLHTIDVTYNYEKVKGSPFSINVIDPNPPIPFIHDVRQENAVYRSSSYDIVDNPIYQSAGSTVVETRTHRSNLQDLSAFLISLGGTQYNINDLQLVVTAPNGEQVPAKILKAPNGEYKVEYSTTHVGRHTIDIYYNGQRIGGSPYFVDVFDPQRVRVDQEYSRQAFVNQETGLRDIDEAIAEIDRVDDSTPGVFSQEAGRADLTAMVYSPSGQVVPHQILETTNGTRIAYNPAEYGIYKIYAYYGGVEVPGCPIVQEIRANQANITAHGDGLVIAEEGSPATFYVDSHGAPGDLFVEVGTSNSLAKCNIVQEREGYYRVTYTPVECGVYDVQIKWNDREINGSPFHPQVIDTRRVAVVGGWHSVMDTENRVHLVHNETKRIVMDTTTAGPGSLEVTATGPDGRQIPVNIHQQNDGKTVITFTPVQTGEHRLSVLWCKRHIPGSPFLCYCHAVKPAVDHTKVILTGMGLVEAKVNEEAEFTIDGSQAGEGTPFVVINGVKKDIPVFTDVLGGDRYRVRYTPEIPGAYLLHIQWSDRAVKDSPFKINVIAMSDASKVLCSGDGLKMGIYGSEITSMIDTRRAGPGELTAQCTGPSKVAYCELYDHRDGTFSLKVKAQEPGKHLLHIRYGGENVPGSPFVLKVAAPPDARMVRVKGPGVEHGILATFQSRFLVETKGAGAGQLTVRIRGPRGAFRVEMQRETSKDRCILCRYDPTEVGDYVISVCWSGEDVPGSPFQIQIFDTQEELDDFIRHGDIRNRSFTKPNTSIYSDYGRRSWNAEI